MVVNRHPESIVKILLVDDLRVVREKLKSILKSNRDLQIVGTAIDGYSAIEQLEHLQPDIVLLDLDMPRLNGIETAIIIDKKYPQIKVIILSSYEDRHEISNLEPNCIKEYIVKDNLDLQLADRIRAVYHGTNEQLASLTFESQSEISIRHDNVVKFSRFSAESKTNFTKIDSGSKTHFGTNLSTQFSSIAHTTFTSLNDWSNSAKELIEMMPLPWTRGLLYTLVAFLSISIPWTCFYEMDEIGTARGRLEAKGNTIKRESDLDSSVAVVKVYVKKGEVVKAGQIIMELDPKNVREQIYQNQIKLDSEQQRLNQFLLMKNQIGLGTTAQQQQNQAQLLEKQSQIAQANQNISILAANSRNQIAEKLAQLHQAEQTLIDRQSSYNLQQAEKLTQIRQAEQIVIAAQTNQILTKNRLTDAQTELNRYNKLYQTGAVSEVKVKDLSSLSQEKNQLFAQSVANLQQSKLRLKEQQDNYRKLLQQAGADISQAKLRLKEQQEIYQGTIDRTQAEISQAKLRLTEQQRGSQTLAKGGNIAVLRTEQQFKEIENQIVTLKAEIERARSQHNFLTEQLKKYTIRSNTDGTIFELPIDREGAVVQPKQLIAEIASNSNGLVFKGEILANQSESLRSDLDNSQAGANLHKDVKLKFDEFPFESYDIVKGKLTWISPNSKLTQVSPGMTVASYDIEVQLSQSCVKHEGNCIPFRSGQPATAEVVIRNRRIIDFILDPFRKLQNN